MIKRLGVIHRIRGNRMIVHEMRETGTVLRELPISAEGFDQYDLVELEIDKDGFVKNVTKKGRR